MQYRVEWTIDEDADSPEEAARQALARMRNPASIATVFDVIGEDGETIRVDLEEIDQERSGRDEPSETRAHHPDCPANDGFGCRCEDLDQKRSAQK